MWQNPSLLPTAGKCGFCPDKKNIPVKRCRFFEGKRWSYAAVFLQGPWEFPRAVVMERHNPAPNARGSPPPQTWRRGLASTAGGTLLHLLSCGTPSCPFWLLEMVAPRCCLAGRGTAHHLATLWVSSLGILVMLCEIPPLPQHALTLTWLCLQSRGLYVGPPSLVGWLACQHIFRGGRVSALISA